MGILNSSKINKWKFPWSCIPSNALGSEKCSITDILLQDAGKVLGIEWSKMKEIRFGPSILFHSSENTIKLSHPEKFPFNKQPHRFQSPLEYGCWNCALCNQKGKKEQQRTTGINLGYLYFFWYTFWWDVFPLQRKGLLSYLNDLIFLHKWEWTCYCCAGLWLHGLNTEVWASQSWASPDFWPHSSHWLSPISVSPLSN